MSISHNSMRDLIRTECSASINSYHLTKNKKLNEVIKLAISWRFWQLLGDIRRLIETARQNISVTVNAGLTILYWQVGNRIRPNILKDKQQQSIY